MRNACGSGWNDYLADFHAERPGITACVLSPATDGRGGTPYDWVADALPRDGVIVDVACGSAPLANRFGRRWIGFDRSVSELCRAGPVTAGRVAVADAASAPLRAGAADVVVCAMALMVVDDPGAAVAEMARMLRVGGSLVVLLPARAPLGLRDRLRYVRLLGALRLRDLPFRHDGVLHDPRSVLAGAGLTVASVEHRRFAFPITGPDAADLFVRSLYLPQLQPERLRAARRVVRRWAGSSIGIPLQRLVATKLS